MDLEHIPVSWVDHYLNPWPPALCGGTVEDAYPPSELCRDCEEIFIAENGAHPDEF